MILLILGFTFAFLDWYVVATDRRQIEYFAKPATMVFLILWFVTKLPAGWNWFSLLILLGLILSLGGDIFLMLPGNWFLAGLIAFVLAHLAYIGGLFVSGFVFEWKSLFFAGAILAAAIPIYLRIREALIGGGKDGLVIPVTFYVIVISIMVFSASTRLLRPDWSFQAGLMVTVGAALFFISDAILAWNRFVKPLTRGRLISIIPYHLAQYFIAFGVIQQIGAL